MNDYFKPLRRKIGVVTLAMACLFAAGWVRSIYRFEKLHLISSSGGELYLSSADSVVGAFFSDNWSHAFMRTVILEQTRVVSHPLYHTFEGKNFLEDTLAVLPHGWDCCGLKAVYVADADMGYAAVLIIPYWSIVIPLTLLSAWLLLSRTRMPRLMPPAAEKPR